jgi:hypothetical protein
MVADVPAGADVDLITETRVAKAVLAIPEGFARTLAQGRTATVQLLLDGADANTATTVLGYATALAADALSHVRGPERPDMIRDEVLADIFEATARRTPAQVALVSSARAWLCRGRCDYLRQRGGRLSLAPKRRA